MQEVPGSFFFPLPYVIVIDLKKKLLDGFTTYSIKHIKVLTIRLQT